MSFGVCQEISTENLNMCRTDEKFLPRLSTNDRKQQCVNLCLQLREKANEDPTFTSICRVTTGDERWIYGYDPETKQQLSQWKSPQTPRAKKVWHTTANSDIYSYCDILRRLRENVQQKRPELWRNHNWLHRHDNAPAHTSLKTTEYVTTRQT
jgi:hypothetical protein